LVDTDEEAQVTIIFLEQPDLQVSSVHHLIGLSSPLQLPRFPDALTLTTFRAV
jgi:hypothetical protein